MPTHKGEGTPPGDEREPAGSSPDPNAGRREGPKTTPADSSAADRSGAAEKSGAAGKAAPTSAGEAAPGKPPAPRKPAAQRRRRSSSTSAKRKPSERKSVDKPASPRSTASGAGPPRRRSRTAPAPPRKPPEKTDSAKVLGKQDAAPQLALQPRVDRAPAQSRENAPAPGKEAPVRPPSPGVAGSGRPPSDRSLPPLPREPLGRRLRHAWRRSGVKRRWLPVARNRALVYARLTRLDRPIGTFLLLWPTLWALWLAGGGHPSPLHFVVFVAGTFLMRSAGCAINDFADRRFDPHVRRTNDRPLATGAMHPVEALAVFAALALAALGLAFTLNRLALWLAVPGAFLAATYPFAKRFSHLPQLYLGVAFGWGIPMAFAAETGALPPVTWLLLIVNILWATAYDTMYAMADRPDDVKIGVKSTAILFGELDRTIVAILQLSVLIGLMLAGLRLRLAPVYYWGLGAAACFALYQQWLIRKREPQRCFQAFLNNNWFGAAVFAGILLQQSFRG